MEYGSTTLSAQDAQLQLGQTRSLNSNYEVVLTFVNETPNMLEFFWLGFDAQPVKYFGIPPYGTLPGMQTFLTHPWMIQIQGIPHAIVCVSDTQCPPDLTVKIALNDDGEIWCRDNDNPQILHDPEPEEYDPEQPDSPRCEEEYEPEVYDPEDFQEEEEEPQYDEPCDEEFNDQEPSFHEDQLDEDPITEGWAGHRVKDNGSKPHKFKCSLEIDPDQGTIAGDGEEGDGNAFTVHGIVDKQHNVAFVCSLDSHLIHYKGRLSQDKNVIRGTFGFSPDKV